MKLSKFAELPNVTILSREAQRKVSGGCGVHYYDTHGRLYEQAGSMTMAAAKSTASAWNANHSQTCGANCGAVAKWCCASCAEL